MKRKYSKPSDIDQKQWLIQLDEGAKKSYAEMREKEEEWLKKCEEKGCLVKDIGRRRWLVQVPVSLTLPSFDEAGAARLEYAEMAASLAAEQGKKLTVGSRTSEMPQWVNGTFLGEPPPLPVNRIRTREQAAYRGGALKINDAIKYLIHRFEVTSNQRDNANQKYKHQRVLEFDQNLSEIEKDLAALKKLLNKKVFARAKSGDALKINVKREGEASFTVSMPAVLLVPVVSHIDVAVAPKRAPRAGTPVLLKSLRYFDIYSALDKH